VINYKTTDWTESCTNANFDVIFDVCLAAGRRFASLWFSQSIHSSRQFVFSSNFQTVGGYESWDKCKRNRVLKSSGHYCTIAGDFSAPVSVGNILQIAVSRINRAFWSWTLDPTYHDMIADPNAADLEKVTELIERGVVRTRADSYVFADRSRCCCCCFS
jgi:hypothetical protein